MGEPDPPGDTSAERNSPGEHPEEPSPRAPAPRVHLHLRNTVYLSSVEGFWGAGMNLVSMGTVLPVFLERLGASYAVIALLPALSALGVGAPQLLSGYLTRKSRRRKGWVMGLHVLAPSPLAVIALCLYEGLFDPLVLTLAGWALFYLLLGLLFPLWLDYMVAILDPARRGRAFGTIFFIQTIAGVGGVSLASWFLSRSASNETYALLFALAWAVLSAGALFFSGTREEDAESEPGAIPTLPGHLASVYRTLRETRWIKAYMAARWLVRGTYPLILNFYAVFAVNSAGVTASEAALFGAAALSGQAFGGLAAGFLGDHLGHRAPTLLGQASLVVAAGLLLLPLPGWAYFAVAALTGMFLATEYTSQTNWLMDLSAPGKRQTLLALAGFLLTPAGVLAPVAGGWAMDLAGFKAVAAVVGLSVLAAMIIEYRVIPLRALRTGFAGVHS